MKSVNTLLLFAPLTALIICSLIAQSCAPPGLTAEDALYATYPSMWTQSKTLALHDGSYAGDPLEEGLESRLQVELDSFALGNIDGNGGGDVAAILVSTVSTPRAYYDMHVLVEREGEAVHAGNVYLGDRIQLQCLRIQRDRMMLQWIPHVSQLGSNDRSHSLVTKFFAIRNGLLVEIN